MPDDESYEASLARALAVFEPKAKQGAIAAAKAPTNVGASELARVADALDAQHAPGTRRTYNSAWKSFEMWCKRDQHASMPAHPGTITLYLSERASLPEADAMHASIPYLRLSLAAIAQKHAERFPYEIPPTHAPAVAQVMEGLTKKYGKPKTKKRGLMIEDFERMILAMPVETLLQLRDRTLLVVTYAMAGRRSEGIGLRMSYFTETKDGYSILLPKSKGDQIGEGQRIDISRNDARPHLCPVRALREWFVKGQPIDYVFARPSGKPLDGAYIARLIKKYTAAIGLNPTIHSGHSLRRGHINQARRDGHSREDIRRKTRHVRDETLQEYYDDLGINEVDTSANLGTPVRKAEKK